MLAQYRHGVTLRREAARYTLKALGHRYGISANAVWARLSRFNVEPDPSAIPYAEILAQRVRDLEETNIALRRKIANLELG